MERPIMFIERPEEQVHRSLTRKRKNPFGKYELLDERVGVLLVVLLIMICIEAVLVIA